jgi:hypothetical protein
MRPQCRIGRNEAVGSMREARLTMDDISLSDCHHGSSSPVLWSDDALL